MTMEDDDSAAIVSLISDGRSAGLVLYPLLVKVPAGERSWLGLVVRHRAKGETLARAIDDRRHSVLNALQREAWRRLQRKRAYQGSLDRRDMLAPSLSALLTLSDGELRRLAFVKWRLAGLPASDR